MTSVSNISIGANIAGAAAAKARHGMNEAIARLSTGRRSMYGGDAAGQSTAFQLKARGMSYAQAGRNTEDGISVAQTIEGALMEIAALGQRLRELGVQAENSDIHSTDDVSASTAEVTAITATIDAIVSQTLFNGVSLMSAGGTATINIGTTDTTGNDYGIESSQIAATSGTTTAANAIGTANTLLGEVGVVLGNMAAAQSALKARQGVAYNTSANLLAAASRMEETDFAKSSANLAKAAILNQSAMAMVAQANQAQSAVLAVIQ